MSNIIGISKLSAKLDLLTGNAMETLEKSVNKNIKLIQNAAKTNCGFKHSNGQLRNSIVSKTKKVSNSEVQGEVSTNVEYAP